MNQLDFANNSPTPLKPWQGGKKLEPTRWTFDGETYEAGMDLKRLKSQTVRVWYLMRDCAWRSLSEITQRVGGTEASISARLRDLRKERFGSLEVDRRRAHGGLWVYRINPDSIRKTSTTI